MMIAKARALPADEVVIDLEDAVAEESKDEARATASAALAQDAPWRAHGVAVRVNGVATPHWERDVTEAVAAAGDAIGSVVVPKVESVGDVAKVSELLRDVERSGRSRPVAVQALIETAAGLTRVNDVARAGPRLETLIIGYADLAASLGRPPGAPSDGDPWHFARESVLVAARAAGLQAIDGPHLDIRDLGGMRAAALRARAAGYDGKWAVHPTQVEPLNEIFTPSDEELERAEAVLAALERSRSGGGPGALMVDGEMIDEASAKLAERVAARATRRG